MSGMQVECVRSSGSCPHCGYPIKATADRKRDTPSKPIHRDYVSPEKEQIVRGAPPSHVVKQAKSRGVYVILGLFLGLLGIQNFYAGYFGRGASQLLISLILGWCVIGLVVVAFWVIIELFVITHDAAGDQLV